MRRVEQVINVHRRAEVGNMYAELMRIIIGEMSEEDVFAQAGG